MSSPNLDVFNVAQAQIFEETIKQESGIAEGWWSAYRERKEKKLGLAIGAIPEKEPVPEVVIPRLAMGRAAQRPLSTTFGKTSSMREFDQAMVTSELHDYFRATKYYTRRPFHKKGIPTYYGRTLHGVSSDGTDISSRAH